MSDQDKQPESQQPTQQPTQQPQKQPQKQPQEPVAEKTVPAAPEAAKPAPATPAAPVGAAKPAAPPKQPLEVSAAGKALAAAVAEARIGLDEPKPDSFGNPIFDVAPERLVETGTALREKLGITFLSCLAPVDWPDRWEVVIHLYDFPRKTWLGLKTRIPKDQLKVPSVTPIWPAADWYEREGYDMYGIEFEGHPHLCRILMADDWQTFPLRKDHPMDMEGGY